MTKPFKSAVVPNCGCPICKAPLDRAMNPEGPGKLPEKGDVSICFYCLTALEFTEGLNLAVLDIEKTTPECRRQLAELTAAMMTAPGSPLHRLASLRRRERKGGQC